jgi:hypothetical protein
MKSLGLRLMVRDKLVENTYSAVHWDMVETTMLADESATLTMK